MSLEDSKLPRNVRFRYETSTGPGAKEPIAKPRTYTRDLRPPHEGGTEGSFEVVEPAAKLAADSIALDAAARLTEPVAIIVFHGMGEQVRYETLGDLAKSLLETTNAPVRTTVTMSRPADSFVVRAEIAWIDTDPEHTLREVHLYEAYWAPITEGQITYYETLKFLAQAAWTGFKSSRFGKKWFFQRWMFGGVVRCEISARTKAGLLWVAVALGLIAGILLLLSVELANMVRTIASGPITLKVLLHFLLPLYSAFHRHWIGLTLSLLFWPLVGLSFFVRYFIIEYVGDVAAYISPYKASKFQSIRDKIQKVGFDTASLVFGFTSSPIPRYSRVFFVGHSLGSVIAYDTLNAMINLDLTSNRQNDVVGRTHSLITFGSPLDKTAFLFRNQANTLSDPLREQMAAASQPLIVDYQFRQDQFKWTNIYAPADVISGSLEYYDDPADPEYAMKKVINKKDPKATTPFAAHVQYWKNPLLSEVLIDEIRRH